MNFRKIVRLFNFAVDNGLINFEPQMWLSVDKGLEKIGELGHIGCALYTRDSINSENTKIWFGKCALECLLQMLQKGPTHHCLAVVMGLSRAERISRWTKSIVPIILSSYPPTIKVFILAPSLADFSFYLHASLP